MSVEVVARIKQDLLNRGINLDENCGAFQITARAIWELQADGWGMIFSGGNGCNQYGENYRVDTMMQKDGTVIDILARSGSNEGKHYPEVPHESYNIPAWQPVGPQPPSNWRAPINLDANVPPTPEPPEPEPPDDNPTLVLILAKLVEMDAQLDAIQEQNRVILVETEVIKNEARQRKYFNNIIRELHPRNP